MSQTLEAFGDDLCVLCMEQEVDPNRDDGFCKHCGAISDEWNVEEEEKEE